MVTPASPELAHGLCHLMAMALHRKLGLKIGAWLAYDHHIGKTCLTHAFAVVETATGGLLCDAHGVHTPEELAQYYADEVEDPADIVFLTESQLLDFAEGPDRDAAKIEGLLQQYRRAIDEVIIQNNLTPLGKTSHYGNQHHLPE